MSSRYPPAGRVDLYAELSRAITRIKLVLLNLADSLRTVPRKQRLSLNPKPRYLSLDFSIR